VPPSEAFKEDHDPYPYVSVFSILINIEGKRDGTFVNGGGRGGEGEGLPLFLFSSFFFSWQKVTPKDRLSTLHGSVSEVAVVFSPFNQLEDSQ